jgi:hypothetical protein
MPDGLEFSYLHHGLIGIEIDVTQLWEPGSQGA